MKYLRLYAFRSLGSMCFVALVSFVLTLALPLIAFGHGAGASWEATEGTYKLDIGYTRNLSAGQSTVFDFNLLKEGSEEEIGFESVWVRLGGPGGVSFAGRLHGSASDRTILTYKFEEAGEHALLTRFVGKEGILAEHNFVFSVSDAEENAEKNQFSSFSASMLIYSAVAFLLGAILTYIITTRRHV